MSDIRAIFDSLTHSLLFTHSCAPQLTTQRTIKDYRRRLLHIIGFDMQFNDMTFVVGFLLFVSSTIQKGIGNRIREREREREK